MGEPDRAQAVKGASQSSLGELASVFIKLGLFGFGGPVATMAMMEEEAVRRRAWMTPEEFGEIYAVCKLLPGPVSVQMAIYLGRERCGIRGGLVSGGLFILPCFVMVLGLSAVYADSGIVQGAGAVLGGLQAAALAIILFSTWGLGKTYRASARAWLIAISSGALIYFHPSFEPLVILGFGLLGVLGARSGAVALLAGGVFLGRSAFAGVKAAASTQTLFNLFLMCCKAGFFVFGTGLAVVPVLEGDAVGRYHWLTHSQFMDGLALGQVTPGPVVITATFIGYLAARLPGAIAATFGMFLPSFINVLFLVPRVWRRFSGTPGARGFASCAIPAVIGGILGTTLKLGLMTVTSWQPLSILIASIGAVVAWNTPAWALIPLAGLAGGLLSRF